MDEKPELLQQLERDILAYDAEAAVATAEAIAAAGLNVMAAIDVATATINVIGDQFQAGEIYLPELMLAGEALKECMVVLSAHLGAGESVRRRGKVVIGAVAGDIHDIGKNLVATQLTVKGFDVIDLGVNVPPMEFVDRAVKERAHIIALSALMTTSMPYQQDVINLLCEMGTRDRYFVIVGGGPVTPEFAQRIGADGFGANAVSAAKACEQLLEGGQHPPLFKTLVEA